MVVHNSYSLINIPLSETPTKALHWVPAVFNTVSVHNDHCYSVFNLNSCLLC